MGTNRGLRWDADNFRVGVRALDKLHPIFHAPQPHRQYLASLVHTPAGDLPCGQLQLRHKVHPVGIETIKRYSPKRFDTLFLISFEIERTEYRILIQIPEHAV